MYAGQAVEQATTKSLFARPLHPYTQGLMASVPNIEAGKVAEKLKPVPGTVPDPSNFPTGCRFNPRCPYATDQCRNEMPLIEKASEEHWIRCHRWKDIQENPEGAKTKDDALVSI